MKKLKEMFAEFRTFVWMDVSIILGRKDGFRPYFKLMEKGALGPVQMIHGASHSMRFADHPGTFIFFLLSNIRLLLIKAPFLITIGSYLLVRLIGII